MSLLTGINGFGLYVQHFISNILAIFIRFFHLGSITEFFILYFVLETDIMFGCFCTNLEKKVECNTLIWGHGNIS